MAGITIAGGIGLGIAALSAGASVTSTVLSAASASDAADRAKAQRDKQAAVQNRALRDESYQRDKDKQRKRAADIQSEREAALVAGGWNASAAGVGGTVLGNPGGAKTTLGV